MATPFPSLEFFQALQASLDASPARAESATPSEAYCGFSIDEQLFVFEFDGRECAAVVSGGNMLDLDFVLTGSRESWLEALCGKPPRSLAECLGLGSLRVDSADDDGDALAQAALPMLQAFVDGARELEWKAA